MQSMNAAVDSGADQITLRVNSLGGSVHAGYGLVAKIDESAVPINIKVDGVAASMAAFACVFAKSVECLDVSEFIFHRADMWSPTDSEKEYLRGVNAKMRKKMESKIDSELWASVTGVTYDQMFDENQRLDVVVDAKKAKKLGIVKKINVLSPVEAKAISAMSDKYITADESSRFDNVFKQIRAAAESIPENRPENKPVNPKPIIKMTIDQLKAEHPDVFAAAVKQGVQAERDRVGAYMVYADVDIDGVKKGIESGEAISQTAMAEFTRKAISADLKKGATAETTKTVITDAPETDEQKQAKEIEAAAKRIADAAKAKAQAL